MPRLIDNNIWNRRSFSILSPEEKLLFLYLETSPETNYYGVFIVPNDSVISARTNLSEIKVKNLLAELQKMGKILLIEDYLIIFGYFDRQINNESEKTLKGLENFEKSLPNQVLRAWSEGGMPVLEGGMEGVSSPHEENRSKVKESKVKEKEIKEPPSRMLEDGRFVFVWKAYEEHRRKKRSSMTEHAADLILKDLEGIGLENAILAIEESMKRGWTGVFTDKFKAEKKPPDKGFTQIKTTAI